MAIRVVTYMASVSSRKDLTWIIKPSEGWWLSAAMNFASCSIALLLDAPSATDERKGRMVLLHKCAHELTALLDESLNE